MDYQITNCYRALLAQINHLDSIYQPKSRLKELYEETSILAYYIMENDSKNVLLNIQELILLNQELQMNNQGIKNAEVQIICTEIETHLKFLTLEYRKCC